MIMARFVLVCSVMVVGVIACTVQPQAERPLMPALIDGENNCRLLWRHTFWVERQLNPNGSRTEESLRAAVDDVSAKYAVSASAFSHCWGILKEAGHQPRYFDRT